MAGLKDRLQFSTVDVFTTTSSSRFSEGNPLAIVKLTSSVTLSQEQKQLIAREFNYSETVFIHEPPIEENCWTLDIFTTYRELPFAGHPTIGSACFMLEEVSKSTRHEFAQGAFITKAGKIPISYEGNDVKSASAEIPHNFRVHKDTCSQSELIRLQPNLIYPPAVDSPVASIVRGMTFVLIELHSLTSLGSVNVTPLAAAVNLDEGWESFVGQYFYFRDGVEGNTNTILIRSRMMAEGWEDPATGSAACTLACYLSLKEAKPGGSFTYKITQGVEMRRKCEISVRVQLDAAGALDKVYLNGRSVNVMNGTVAIP
jgi:PhzF family phenazine biosynthesis protein